MFRELGKSMGWSSLTTYKLRCPRRDFELLRLLGGYLDANIH